MYKPFLIDVPVALIFFNRPEVFEQVFQRIREIRPSKLFLIQDGARANKPLDSQKIKECRDIANNVDWDCKIVRDYSDVNLGCGRRVFTGISNAFKVVDRLVIIEDDIIVSDTFLQFCKELLEKYKEDERIGLISGMNQLGVYKECPFSYFCSQGGGAIWGWATWKRVWEKIDWHLPMAGDEYLKNTLVRNNYYGGRGKFLSERLEYIHNMISQGQSPSFWSFHFGIYSYINNQLNIVPKYNMISNIGLTNDSTHAINSKKKLPSNIQKLFFGKRYNIEFPLVHPQYIIDDRSFYKKQIDFMAPGGIKKIYFRIEYIIRRIIFR